MVRTFDKLRAAALAVLENGQRTNNEPQAVDPKLALLRTSLDSAHVHGLRGPGVVVL